MLTRIATVKNDGTVEVELPSSVEPPFEPRSPYGNGDVVDEEELVDFRYMRPLQIAILIVGTRGDVQPFVAIGKLLQVVFHVK